MCVSRQTVGPARRGSPSCGWLSKYQTGRQIEPHNDSESNSGNLKLVCKKELASLISIFDSQEALSKKAKPAGQDQPEHESSYGHFQCSCREDEHFEGGRRRQQRRHQDADETISLGPCLNSSRAGASMFAEHGLAPFSRKVIQEQTASHRTERRHSSVIGHARGIVN